MKTAIDLVNTASVGFKVIPLQYGEISIVDDEDFHLFDGRSCCKIKGGYGVRVIWDKEKKKSIREYMHRLIMRPPPGMCVDHINRNKLDNRRSNLRLATYSQNSCNRGPMKRNKIGLKGVSKQILNGKWNGKWRSGIGVNGKLIYLGIFDTPELAANAYAAGVKKYHGEFGSVK